MHATYLFWAPVRSIQAIVDAFYAWIEERGDENNWFELLCAVNDAGEKALLATPGDWRHRDELAQHYLQAYGTLEKMKKLAWECVATKLWLEDAVPPVAIMPSDEELARMRSVEEVWDAMSLEEWPRYFFRRAFERLREWGLDVPIPKGPDDKISMEYCIKYAVRAVEAAGKKKGPSLELYQAGVLVEGVSRLWDVYLRGGTLPFVLEGTPYDFRAFDLSPFVKQPGEGESVLAVDIHT